MKNKKFAKKFQSLDDDGKTGSCIIILIEAMGNNASHMNNAVQSIIILTTFHTH